MQGAPGEVCGQSAESFEFRGLCAACSDETDLLDVIEGCYAQVTAPTVNSAISFKISGSAHSRNPDAVPSNGRAPVALDWPGAARVHDQS